MARLEDVDDWLREFGPPPPARPAPQGANSPSTHSPPSPGGSAGSRWFPEPVPLVPAGSRNRSAGYGPGLEDADLREAQRGARDQEFQSALGQIGLDFSAALRGEKADRSFYDGLNARAAKGVGDIQARRQASDQEMARRHAQGKMDEEASLADPSSEDSQFLARLGESVGLGDVFRGRSAAQILRGWPQAKDFLDEARARRKATAEAEGAKTKRQQEVDDLGRKESHDVTMQTQRDVAAKERARILAAAQGAARGEKRVGDAEKALADEVRDLAKAIPDDAAGFFDLDAAINTIVARNKGDIPGVGQFDSLRPDFLQSSDGIELSKNARQMMLAYQKLVTGTGGGAKELEEIRQAGLALNNERSFLSGLDTLRRGYTARLAKVKAGYSPKAVEVYEGRVPGLPKSAGPGAAQVEMVDPSGRAYTVDAAEADEAEANGWKRRAK